MLGLFFGNENGGKHELLSLSPVYVNGQCPYIPSFSDMLNGTVDQRLLNFAWQATKHRRTELTYWNFNHNHLPT